MSEPKPEDAPAKRKGGGRRSRIVRLRVVEVCADYPEDMQRPKTRGECSGVPRPCPFASCRYHLAIEAVPPKKGGRGKERLPGLQYNFPDIEVADMRESCALDVADRGEATLEEVGAALGISRQGVEQQESKTFVKLSRRKGAEQLMQQMRERASESQERSGRRK